MRISNIKSKYNLLRSLQPSQFNVKSLVQGNKKELMGELNKIPNNNTDYYMIIIDGRDVKL